MSDIPIRDGRPCPWAIYRLGKETQHIAVLEWAQNYADKAYPVGLVTIEHLETGEQWKRERGEWRQTRMAQQPELALDKDSAA